jgi:hypothetical protein
VTQAGLCFFPKRLVDVVGNLACMLGVYDARQFARRDRNLPVFASSVGEPHDLVCSVVENVHRKCVAGRFYRPLAHHGEADHLLEVLQLAEQLVGVGGW